MRRIALGLIAVLATAGCDGSSSLEMDLPYLVESSSRLCQGLTEAPPPKMTRLNPSQLTNSWRDLLADSSMAVQLQPAAGTIISELEVEKLNAAAEYAVGLGKHQAYLPCPISGSHDAGCARAFIASFGKVAFRRPLAEDERVMLFGVYEQVRQSTEATFTFKEAIDALAQVILQAPQHLYLHERGEPGAGLPKGVRQLTGHERAARLSYLLWNSTPDAQLTQAADSGALGSASAVRAQADRLLAHPRGRDVVRRFVGQWLELDGTNKVPALEAVPKSATLFPFDSPALRAAMRKEVEALYERQFFEPGGSFRGLMTSTEAYVNGPLATLYGAEGGPTSEEQFAWVNLDGAQRSGVFTRAAFLTQRAGAEVTSPIHRGVFLYREALCQPLGDAPPDVNNAPVPPSPDNPSVRQEVEARTSPTYCQTCHKLINPFGFALENYNAIGKWQSEETGEKDGAVYTVAVDAQVTIPVTDVAGTLKGGAQLSAALGQSDTVHDCMAKHWFTRAFAREPVEAECSLEKAREEFRRTSDLRGLVLSLLSSEAALYIREDPL